MYTKNRQSTGNIVVVILCAILLLFILSFNLRAEEEKAKDEVFNTSLLVEFGVDYNRDGKIEFPNQDTPYKPTLDTISKTEPYVFWLNDDDDKHQFETEGNDVPGTKSSWFGMNWIGDYNYESDGIDGSRDLIDFFPVAINFYDFFTLIPDEAKDFTYKLKHADEAVNIVYTEMITDNTNFFLKEVDVKNLKTLLGTWQNPRKLENITTHQVKSDGISIPIDFIDFLKKKDNKGVLLVEVRAESEEPLVLSIENKEGEEVLSVKLPLKLVQVEDMYAQVNIRGLVNKDGGDQSYNTSQLIADLKVDQKAIIDNKNVPKSFDKTKQFVFLHGYKVTPEKARAWHAEMFKRLFQSGSNAMYVGFSWDSDEGAWLTDGLFNYWGNVENALNSASIVADIINNSLIGDITIAAHSLGNMVLGQAIQQYGLAPNYYFMLNPAVPTEAYNASQLAETGDPKQNFMTIPDWYDFYDETNNTNPRRLFASDWNRLFTANVNDKRQELTWRNLFSSVATANLYNFYSTGEEVLVHSTGAESTSWDPTLNGGLAAWITQEHQKGKKTLASGLSGAEAGWGFNCRQDQWDWTPDFACLTNRGLSTTEAFALTNEQLRKKPFAKPFLQDDFFSEDVALANKAVEDYKDHTLAFGLPALSHAAGSTLLEVGDIPQVNINMNTQLKMVGWPQERGSDDVDKNWLHSDAKDISYRYVHTLYDTWVEKGQLNK